MLLRTVSIPNSFVQGHRPLLFNIRQLRVVVVPIKHSANRSSCHNCLRRCCTLSGAVHRTVRSRTEKADAMTFCSQLDPQTSTWFDHSAEDSSRTVSYLVRRLRPALYIVSHPGDPAVPFSSTFSRRLSFSDSAI